MANRVTEEEVRVVVKTSLSPLDPYITSANLIVTEELEGHECMTEARLKQVELYLSAHIIAMVDGKNIGVTKRLRAESIDKEIAIPPMTGDGLKQSRFGQLALMFDCTGYLSTLGMKQPSIRSIGSI